MTELRQDVGYALRVLRRTPGFTAVAIATLALGIGGTTAIFSVVDAVLLRPLRFAEAQRLAFVWTTAGSRVSPGYLQGWRLESRMFQDLAGWVDLPANLTGAGDPLEVLADRVTPNFFTVLGAPALIGRTFRSERTLARVDPEVVLSHGLWQRRYGGDPGVVGRSITLDGRGFTIVGVMPEGFTVRTVELSHSRAELWMPLALVPEEPGCAGGNLNVVGRLAGGATAGQAQAELSLITHGIEARHPSPCRDWGALVVPLHEATVKDVRVTLLVLLEAVGILLLIACANVANLVLSRAATRRTELAIRISLGATGRRLLRQLLTESLVLAVVGGALGTLLATSGTALIVSALPAGLDLPRTDEIHVDLRILASIHSSRGTPHSALQEAARGSSSVGRRNRLGSALVVSEVALALILLAGAGLLGRSFWELSRVDPGFRAERVLTLRTTLPASRYGTDDRIRVFGNELLERVAHLPGIRAVGVADYLPLTNVGTAGFFEIDGRPTSTVGDRPSSWISVVGGDYFQAMGIPLLRGRLPGPADTEKTQPVLVIDEALSRRFWPDKDPIGTRLAWRRGERKLSGEIVGVVGSVRWAGMAANMQATTYFWFPQDPGRQLTIVARTSGEPTALAGLIAAEVRAIDPNQPVADVHAMRDLVSANLAQARFTMLLLGVFAAGALLLAVIGLYGVLAFSVTQRTREIGVRVALGAQYGDVLRLVLRRGILLIGAGLAIGMVAALALGSVVAGLLYGVKPTDPPTLLAVALFLALVGLLASYLPARRATRVDPIVALRAE
jgi:putative ABC transport system permease protein